MNPLGSAKSFTKATKMPYAALLFFISLITAGLGELTQPDSLFRIWMAITCISSLFCSVLLFVVHAFDND